MKKLTGKRIGAYIVDALIIYALVSLIFELPFLSNKDKIKEINDNYIEVYDEYLEAVKSSLPQEEINILINDINHYTYMLQKESIISSYINYAMYIIYFVILLYFSNGQTIGKKLFNLKLVANDGTKLKFTQLLLRGVLIYGFITGLANVLLLQFASEKIYLHYGEYISVFELTLTFVSYAFMVFREDGKGLHDLLCKTNVVVAKEKK